ncbi:ABC transporter substrate-binding protein [Oculatella sp. LEGE 06141]|uniref:ABC transporter substrate-binding protein n=1 Tax=Oculatella sp. LEGE 06141 TaxID=1828648 RepID=UPI00187ECC50|nr:ABC transporter substrate-binding protein [Oculatella sp. LEGE 06141]MBE9179620.1 ABC transporter substrate-binding protein [Oculatella sp. LEGE 06141]
MNTKVLGFIALVLAIAILLVSGHGLLSPRSEGATPVVVTLSGWGSSPAEQAAFAQILREFEAEHPDIRVKYEVIAEQYMDVLKTRMIGDAAPDVFFLDALETPFIASKGVLEPLDGYITPEFDLADFEESLLEPFRYEGQLYGLPKDYSTLALFYNKQAFAEVGLSAPPQTWDELLADSKVLTLDRNQDGRTDQYGFGDIPELARQAYKIRAFGGQVVDEHGYAAFASDAGIQGLELVVQQYRQDRTSAQRSDVGTSSGSEMFGQGKVAMVLEGAWAIPYLHETFPNLEYGVAPVPRLNGMPGTMVFTVAYAISQQAQHKAEAWTLLSYLTGKTGMQKWTSAGAALPTRKSVAAEMGYENDALRSPFVAGVDTATPWQVGSYPAIIMGNFDNQFVSAMIGEQPLEQAIKRAQATANQQIRESQ